MKVAVTGAAGFLGRAVVAAARARGHEVIALVRREPAEKADGVSYVIGDLRQQGRWADGLVDADAIIHCASAVSGDLPSQLADTVRATENLLAALPGGLKRLVHVSSFSVYDYYDTPRNLSEQSPLEDEPLRRDAYTEVKLFQEKMVRDACAANAIPLTIARPGAIYGPERDWDHGAALSAGRFDLIFAPFAKMRLTHVDKCAEVLVAAMESPDAESETINIVDADTPTHWRFHRRAARAGAETGIPVPVPYVAVLMLGGAARIASKIFFRGKARLPELLDLPRQRARWRPLGYDRSRLTQLAGERRDG